MQAFQPLSNSIANVNFSLSVTTTSARVAISGGGPDLRVVNRTAQECFIRFTDSSGTAVATDMPIPGGAVEIFKIPQMVGTESITHVAAITATGTTTLSFTSGRGS